MNKLYVFFMMLATLALSVPAFAGQATPGASVSTEMQPTKKELKAQKKEMRKAVRKAIFKKKSNKKKPTADALVLILAILIPPIGVLIYQDTKITNDFWISLVLTLLGWFPGMVYALLVVTNTFSAA